MAVKNLNYNYYLNVSDYIAVDFEQLAQIIDRIWRRDGRGPTRMRRAIFSIIRTSMSATACSTGKRRFPDARIRKSSATGSDRKRTGRQREVILSSLLH